MKRCINLDWLEVYCKENLHRFPCNCDYYRSRGWSVIKREYGTPQYKEMFTLLTPDGEPFLEIRRNPYSIKSENGIFEKNACHIRLSNRTCYLPDPIGTLRNFLTENAIELVGITRIDICLDFAHFDNGDNPQKFLKDYLNGIYSKINQGNLGAHGKDTWQERIWNSISWGSEKSMIRTKMYLKSLELKETKDKPYIRAAWKAAELTESDTLQGLTEKIWRIEFSIHSEAKTYIITEHDEHGHPQRKTIPNTLSCYDNKEKLLSCFRGLSEKYFHFKYFEDGKRKDRCRDKVLFRWTKEIPIAQPERHIARPEPTRTDKILINRLSKIYDNRHNPAWIRRNAKLTAEIIISDMVKKGKLASAEELENFANVCVDYYLDNPTNPGTAEALNLMQDHIERLRKESTLMDDNTATTETSFAQRAQTLLAELKRTYPEMRTTEDLMRIVNQYYLYVTRYADIQQFFATIFAKSRKTTTIEQLQKAIKAHFSELIETEERDMQCPRT